MQQEVLKKKINLKPKNGEGEEVKRLEKLSRRVGE
jgi:hypothetical protein